MIPIIGSEYPEKVIPLIDATKRNIDVVVYDWRWYPDDIAHPAQRLNMAIVRAVKRGVIVRAVVNDANILPLLIKLGIQARRLTARRTLHSKLLILDNEKLVIGSHNFTKNAFAHNVETSVCIDIPTDNTRFFEFFNNIFGL